MEQDGSVRGVAIADLDSDGQLDLAVLEPGSSAGLLVYENRWAAQRKPPARSTSWCRTDGRDRRDGHGRVQPRLAAPGQPVGRPEAADPRLVTRAPGARRRR